MLPHTAQGVCVNRFPGKGRVLYTIYNCAYTTAHGVLFSVPYQKHAVFYDVWNDTPCRTEKKNGFLQIYGTVPAQEVGCILQINKQTDK
jgi:hypothetical protein